MLKLLNAIDENPSAVSVAAPRSTEDELNPHYKYSTPNITSYAMTSHAIADVGYGDILKTNIAGDVFYYLIDVSAYLGDVVPEPAPNDRDLILYRLGMGFRVAVAAWNIKVEATANLGLVAASTQLGAGQSSVIARAFADDIQELAQIFSDVTDLTGRKFDAETLKDLAALVGRFAGVMADKGSTIAPKRVRYAMLTPNRYNPDHIVASNTYAVEQLIRSEPRSKLDKWLADDGHKDWRGDVLSPTIISAAYQNFGVPDDLYALGDPEIREKAERLERLGG